MLNILKIFRQEVAANESRERQSALNFFWWTRNMTAAEIVGFNQNHGGLLSGASLEKESHLIAQMKVDRMGPMSRKEKREQLKFFIEHPTFHPENFVWK